MSFEFSVTGRVAAVRGKAHAYFTSPSSTPVQQRLFDLLDAALLEFDNDAAVRVYISDDGYHHPDDEKEDGEIFGHSFTFEVEPVWDFLS